MNNTRKVGIFLAVALLSLAMTTLAASAATTVTIQSATVDVSENTTVQIMINDVTGIKGAHIILEYDSSVVHALNISNSAFIIEAVKEIDNVTGYVRYSAFGFTALNGDVKFADVILEGKSQGESPLNLTVMSLNNGTGEILPRDVVNGTFTVTGGAPATTGDININEIMYKPAGSDSDYEWIELYNNDTQPINVSGWVLNGTIGGTDTILSGTMGIEEYKILAKNVTAFQARYPEATCTIIKGNWSALATTETIDLWDSMSTLNDSVPYTDIASENHTIELNATGWYESKIEGGTPCVQNSVVGPLVDTTAPTTEVTAPEMTDEPSPIPSGTTLNWTNTDVVLSFRSTDVSGVNYTNYSKTGETGWTTVNATIAIGPDAGNVTGISPTATELAFNVSVSDESTTKIGYYSVDKNETANQEATKNLTVRIDTVDPVINSVDLDTYTPDAGGDILVTVDATDALSGVATVTANGEPLTEQGSPWSGTITAEFLPGTYDVTVNATDDAGNTITNDTVQYTIAEEYDVELTTDKTAETIMQGETATYTLTVTNTGNVADTINLTIDGIGTLSKDSIVDLAAGVSEDVTLDVTSTVVGAHVTTVNAMSQGDVSQTDNVTVTTTVEKKVVHRGGGGGGAPRDSDGDGYSDIQEMIAGTDKDDPCDPDQECAACIATKPAATPTPTAAPTAKPTTPPVPTPEPTPEPTATPEDPGFEAVFAIAGLLAVAYLVLRRKRK